jgi:hypothetical protein
MIHEHSTVTKPRFMEDVLWPVIKQEGRRLTHALGHIITVTAATAVICALFLYVFHDFIGHQLNLIDSDLASQARQWFNAALIILAAAAIGRYVRDILLTERDWGHFLGLQGFAPSVIIQSKKNTAIAMALPAILLTLLLIHRCFGPLTITHVLLGACSTAAAMTVTINKLKTAHPTTKERAPNQSVTGIHPPLTAWRASRLMGNHWKGANLRVFAALPILFGTTSLAMGQPPPLTQICVLAGGIILSWTVPILVSEDLQSTWIERQSSVSHDQWIKAWQDIFWTWAKPIAITTVILVTVSTIVTTSHAPMLDRIVNIVLCGLLAGFPVWMAPAFVMQIDGQRVLTNIMMQTLLFVFAGTALMAIPWLAPALWIIHREAHKYQGGRFARGSFH